MVCGRAEPEAERGVVGKAEPPSNVLKMTECRRWHAHDDGAESRRHTGQAHGNAAL